MGDILTLYNLAGTDTGKLAVLICTALKFRI
jgi:hypothetical protein